MTTRAGVALVFGVPVSRQQFEELARRDHYWDYGRAMNASRATWAERFDAHYAAAAAVMVDLCRVAEERGYTVYQRATLTDLVSAFSGHEIVIVVAHWKNSYVLDADLLPGWELALQTVLSDVANPLAILLANCSNNNAQERGRVRDELNWLIRSRRLRPHMPGLNDQVRVGNLMLEAISREMIDLAFTGHLRPGNSLELYDGLHRAEQIRNAVAGAMPAVLDLSCCNGSVLATYLREHDEQQIISGDAPIIPAPHLRMVHWVLSNLGSDTRGYVELRLAIARALRDLGE